MLSVRHSDHHVSVVLFVSMASSHQADKCAPRLSYKMANCRVASDCCWHWSCVLPDLVLGLSLVADKGV